MGTPLGIEDQLALAKKTLKEHILYDQVIPRYALVSLQLDREVLAEVLDRADGSLRHLITGLRNVDDCVSSISLGSESTLIKKGDFKGDERCIWLNRYPNSGEAGRGTLLETASDNDRVAVLLTRSGWLLVTHYDHRAKTTTVHADLREVDALVDRLEGLAEYKLREYESVAILIAESIEGHLERLVTEREARTAELRETQDGLSRPFDRIRSNYSSYGDD